MASFLENLWTSIFTPGTTPTLLLATNASFAALQLLLFTLLLATRSIHFVVLSGLTASLWWAINWFARELAVEKARAEGEARARERAKRGKSPSSGSDTETEVVSLAHVDGDGAAAVAVAAKTATATATTTATTAQSSDSAVKRRYQTDGHAGDSSGYASTDSEWEKVSGDGHDDRFQKTN